jgi:hypothetical protein
MLASDPKLPIGTNYCKCAACGEYFTGYCAFDEHRGHDGKDGFCRHPSEVFSKKGKPRLKLNGKGYWGSSRVRTQFPPRRG